MNFFGEDLQTCSDIHQGVGIFLLTSELDGAFFSG